MNGAVERPSEGPRLIGQWPMPCGDAADLASCWSGLDVLGRAQDYVVDTAQRTILFLDILRRRGNAHLEAAARTAPNVLSFEFEILVDGRTLPRPVNYGLVRIVPPPGVNVDPTRRPFIVFDPRAGHGPGIGGMKHDSEIGVALQAGHPCYFVGFLTEPVAGQTIEDVCRAEAHFVQTVVDRHPRADGKPVLIGNCQAGWQVMMMASIVPDLVGPLLLAGAPLSYWAGVRGRNPLRYLGGMLGGTWLTALSGDLGAGIFDGANLVANFENMNPANTYWKKAYNVFSKVDTEAGRFLGFEQWWGSPVLLNAGEMQWIADNLFVGNRLSSGEITTSDGMRVDLRNIRSPIIVFCSWGDDITPPQQALDWVLDLYDTDDEIISGGQTIVYTLHQSIGHLGIFVSGKVATKEHSELIGCMDMIDLMPPGLYEAVITEVDPDIANPELIMGRYLFRLERRKLDDIRALGTNSAEDDLRFATVARLSDVNLGLYRTLLAPAVRAMVTPETAQMMRNLHPHRMRFEAFSDRNPLGQAVAGMAEAVRADRRPAPDDNPFRQLEGAVSTWIETALQTYGVMRDTWEEVLFHSTYGNPFMQAAMGLMANGTGRRREGRDAIREAIAARREAELDAHLAEGGELEALVRALIYINFPNAKVDERSFVVLSQIRAKAPAAARLPFDRIKEVAREQFLIVRRDEERAIAALPNLLPDDKAKRRQLLNAIRLVVEASGKPSPETARRLARIEAMIGAPAPEAVK
ncbi:DUF3141 domain-containing protein [Limobrevibacterium gyesilva]|uniref:DUF3141 domain-containing protein n=1 Tax=Limobrevibacterium gyesilva TaxID=2991712 RepID=A0AA41YMJ9_9PROT|nr:DUF3141 domain-containing protein [Limobrevibacterium gyesilva]MCW3475087.1 DUF3141 domain-containing protein [Limobrevibacterium gyesilva]